MAKRRLKSVNITVACCSDRGCGQSLERDEGSGGRWRDEGTEVQINYAMSAMIGPERPTHGGIVLSRVERGRQRRERQDFPPIPSAAGRSRAIRRWRRKAGELRLRCSSALRPLP